MGNTISWSERANWKRVSGRYLRKRAKKRRLWSTKMGAKLAGQKINSPTRAEKLLCDELTRQNIVFVQQKVIVGYNEFRIVDFYLPRGTMTPLIVEVDGSYHDETKEDDAAREKWIVKNTGAKIVRFKNEEIYENVAVVVERIRGHHIIIEHRSQT